MEVDCKIRTPKQSLASDFSIFIGQIDTEKTKGDSNTQEGPRGTIGGLSNRARWGSRKRVMRPFPLVNNAVESTGSKRQKCRVQGKIPWERIGRY